MMAWISVAAFLLGSVLVDVPLAAAAECDESGGFRQNGGEVAIECTDDNNSGGGSGGGGGGLPWLESPGAWNTYQCQPAGAWQGGNRVDLSFSHQFTDETDIVWDLYTVICFGAGTTYQWDFWAEQVIDLPAQAIAVRDSLLAQLRVRVVAPEPEVAASPPVDGTHLVGVWTWFWVDPGSYEALSETASDPAGLTITLTAVPEALRFHPGDDEVMGEQSVLTCAGPGVVWHEGLDDEATDCRHLYDLPSSLDQDGAFAVRAESDWEFTWVASGDLAQYLPSTTGTLGVTTTTSPGTPIVVLEAQAVIR